MTGITVQVPTSKDMVDLGRSLAGLLRPGDVVLLSGELGAGKTTLARGIGVALGVRGDVTSPTFVLARVHQPGAGRTPLVHVDAYRLGTLAEIDDLDLDASLAESVTVVEWGDGKAEGLSEDRLHVRIVRPEGDQDGEDRVVTVAGHGPRWLGVDLTSVAEPAAR